MGDSMDLGKRISCLRKERKITQAELANLLYVTDKTISSWESGRTEPSLEMLIKVSEILQCNVSYLIYGKNIKSDIETEIKIKITEKEYKELDAFFSKSAVFIKENSQLDTYYQPTYRKFLNDKKITEWLRIGKRGNKNILNYKNWYNNMYCDEYEVEIDECENLDKIFSILGLEKIAVVDKKRKEYFYLDQYEIALDYVEKLGYFIEIEVKKYFKSPLEEYDNLLMLAKKLNLNLDNIDKRGYPYHIIYENSD